MTKIQNSKLVYGLESNKIEITAIIAVTVLVIEYWNL